MNDLLRAGARCSLGLFHSTPPGASPSTDPPRTARFRRWMAVVAGPRLREASRTQMLSDLPAFLARDAARDPDAQLQLLSLLDGLYKKTGYQNAFAEPAALADALAGFMQTGDEAPHALFVSDGRTLGVALRHGCLLSSHPPPEIRPTRGLVASHPDYLPASLWIWNAEAPPEPPRDAERLAEGIFTVQAAEPGIVSRL